MGPPSLVQVLHPLLSLSGVLTGIINRCVQPMHENSLSNFILIAVSFHHTINQLPLNMYSAFIEATTHRMLNKIDSVS